MELLSLVGDNVEAPGIQAIYNNLKDHFDDNVVLVARMWQQEYTIDKNKKFIVIITSAEGHRYIPPNEEIFNENCLGIFTHYYPKSVMNVGDQFNPNGFLKVKKTHQLPLGTAKFTGNSDIPILERKYDVTFIGQLDPYVRYDLYSAVQKYKPGPNDNFMFYEGWNKGLGHEAYSEIMSNTKIALVPCGSASLDTFRFYEACQAGCIILTIKQNNYDFMSGSPHIEIPAWYSFREYADYLLNDPDKMVKISAKTKEFWTNNLSPEASAKLILRKLGYE